MNIPLETIRQGLALLPAKMAGCRATTMLVAIGLQESGFLVRRQYGNGPARGFWQFEAGGGVKGVMEHPNTTSYAAAVCAERGVPFERAKVWAALETDDLLAVVFARLLLWSDPKPLPAITEPDAAWNLYARTWRPGKPHPEKWADCHAQALEALA
jgi:hypothetical protein